LSLSLSVRGTPSRDWWSVESRALPGMLYFARSILRAASPDGGANAYTVHNRLSAMQSMKGTQL